MKVTMIAFDADDTLWYAEKYYQNAQEELKNILSPWQNGETVDEIIYEAELRNLPQFGCGVKAFLLTMIDVAIQASDGDIRGEEIEKIIALGRSMLEEEVMLRPHVAETLETLPKTYQLMVITKGDLLDQTAKIARSGLASYFSQVEVVSEKTLKTYRDILDKYSLDPETFLMVGNSLRSDILPILKLGGRAVYIPSDITWAHELVPDFDRSHERFFELDHIGQIPNLIAEIS